METVEAIAFDTHAFVKKLKNVGFTEQQAEVLASIQIDLVEKRLATKSDIIGLKRDIEEIRAELKRDMKEMELRLETKISAQKVDLIKWVFGIAFAQASLIIAILKLL